MRLSRLQMDPLFDQAAVNDRFLHILLDGRDICKVCHTADEELGEAHVYKLDAFGKKYIDPENSQQAAQEILYGKIEIKRTGSALHVDAEAV